MNKHKNIELLRNIGIIAHIDAGKTTVTERILYYTGKNYKIGEVHDGKTVTDYMVQERERGITITSAAVSCNWYYKENSKSSCYQINLIDTPGHVDFTIEVERSLRVLDGAIIVFDGVAGVEPQSETVWRQADKYSVPRICFVNKLDRVGADFFHCLDTIKQKLHAVPTVLTIPIGNENNFIGIIDIISMKGILWNDLDVDSKYGSKYIIKEIPDNLVNLAKKYRNLLIEQCIDLSDSFTEKYLENENISDSEIISTIRFGTIENQIVPVCCGSAFKNKGIQFLLDSIVNFLPSPNDLPNISGKDYTEKTVYRKLKYNEHFSALIFKITSDKYGQLVYLRAYSGRLKKGDYVLNTRTNKKIRVGRLVKMFANKREDIENIEAGDIVAAIGIDAKTGDTISNIENPIILESLTVPPPVMELAIEANSKNDQDRMIIALGKLSNEDPSLRLIIDDEVNQTKIAGMGELHLDIIVDRLKREYDLNVQVGKPQVAYKETITKIVEVEGKYIKQTGGRGQYGHVWLRLSPNDIKHGFLFESKIVGGAIPKEYILSVKKGIQETLHSGIIGGYPIVDISVVLYDGSYHEVDSSEMAFKIAGSLAFKKGAKLANPVILEPIMNAEVIFPEEWMGEVINDLNSRRGRIISIKDRIKLKTVDCSVPLSEMFGFSNDLRSKTQGRATYTMEFDCYREVPKNIEEKLKDKEKM